MAYHNAWDAVVHFLKKNQVEKVFGLPSDDLKALDAVVGSGIEFIIGKDQRNLVFMATGYAMSTERLSVCIFGKGPAITNTLTGILEAKSSCAPLLIIAPGTSRDKKGTGAFQELDQLAVLQSLVKWSYRVEHADQIPWALEKGAFLALNGTPGPVYIELPEDIIDQTVHLMDWKAIEKCKSKPAEKDALEALLKIKAAEKPILLLGGGVPKKRLNQMIQDLSERLGMAVFTTASGRGAVNETFQLYCGGAGLYTVAPLKSIWKEADLIVVLGSRLEETAVFGWEDFKGEVIQVNINPADFSFQYNGMKLLGDIEETLTFWLKQIQEENTANQAWLKKISSAKEESWLDYKQSLEKGKSLDPPNVGTILHEIKEVFPEDCLLVQENGLQDMWAYFYPHFIMGEGGFTIAPSEQTSLGFGAAASLGVQLAYPQRSVIALVGDGAFNLFESDLATAIQYQIPVVYIVLKNGGYGWLQYQWLQHEQNQSYRFTDENMWLKRYEHPFVHHVQIRNTSELKEGLLSAFKASQQKKVSIVEIQVRLNDVHREIQDAYGDFPKEG